MARDITTLESPPINSTGRSTRSHAAPLLSGVSIFFFTSSRRERAGKKGKIVIARSSVEPLAVEFPCKQWEKRVPCAGSERGESRWKYRDLDVASVLLAKGVEGEIEIGELDGRAKKRGWMRDEGFKGLNEPVCRTVR